MERRQALRAMAAAVVALAAHGSRAQSAPGRAVIGMLDASDRQEWWAAFREQMRELGYVEGRNASFEMRFAKGDLDRVPALAQELLRLKPTVVVTSGSAAAVAVRRITNKVPVVMATGTDQVSLGLAATLAHPGGNVTGIATLTSELMTKRFELLREMSPKASRLAVLWHSGNTSSMASVRDVERAAARARIPLQSFGFMTADELADTFAAMTRERAEGMVVVQSPLIYVERRRVAELAIKHRIPAVYGAAEYVDAGGLLSYAPHYPDLFRQAAVYVDKILKGASPGDLPIEQPTKFEIVVNLKTARALGISLPQSIMARADRVIE